MKKYLFMSLILVATLYGCRSTNVNNSNAYLIADLKSALGDKWKISVNSNILTIVSTTNLAWVFVPPSSSEDALDDVYHEPFRIEYRIEPLISQAKYRKMYLAIQKKKQKLQKKIAQLEKNGMPRDAKSVFQPRNKTEQYTVNEYRKVMYDVTTLPVYHYRSSSLFNAKQKPVMFSYEMPGNDFSEHQITVFWKAIDTVFTKYKSPQQD